MTTVGRDRELATITGFLDSAPATERVLLLEGEAGIGKTTLWQAAIAAAQPRHRVLVARPLELETRIPFAAAGDLLAGAIDEVGDALPGPQRRALEAALLLGEADARPEPQSIAFAFLSALRVLSATGPVLVAVDDVQWLDEPSAAAILFAARRLRDEPIRLLLARRTDGVADAGVDFTRVVDRERLRHVPVPPLTRGAIHRILRDELGVTLSRPALQRIHETAAGNPFYALELARPLAGGEGRAVPTLPLPVPQTLATLVSARLARLPETTEAALRVAALIRRPTVAMLAAVLGSEPVLLPAVEAGVARLAGERLEFTHPLLASGLAARVEPAALDDLHRRIAAATSDPEVRAWHLAQAAHGIDPQAAAALDEAAALARSRGSPETAAELLEQALRLTSPSDPGRGARALAAAVAQKESGDFARARVLAEEALASLTDPARRVEGLLLLADSTARPIDLCRQALAEAGADRTLRARVGMSLSDGHRLTDFALALVDARAAVEDAEAAGADALAAETLALRAWLEGACGEGDPLATLRSASRFESSAAPARVTGYRSGFMLATVRMWRDEHELARDGFHAELRSATRDGSAYGRAHALIHLAQVDWRAGAWRRAREHANAAWTEWGDSGDELGVSAVLWTGALVDAHLGHLEAAREAIAHGLSGAASDALFRARHAWLLGFVALCEGDPERASSQLEDAARLFESLHAVEPGMRLFVSDLIDALVATGRLDDAEREARGLLRVGRALGRPRAVAIGRRGEGLVAAARDDLDTAVAALSESAAVAAAFPVPFEHGRTLLALGTLERRTRRRKRARETLERALAIFEELGAPVFAERARAELARIGGRAPSDGLLTPTEARVAALVAEGRSNRDVASALVISVHTVESTLTAVYRKLGVSSRTELAAKLAVRD